MRRAPAWKGRRANPRRIRRAMRGAAGGRRGRQGILKNDGATNQSRRDGKRLAGGVSPRYRDGACQAPEGRRKAATVLLKMAWGRKRSLVKIRNSKIEVRIFHF